MIAAVPSFEDFYGDNHRRVRAALTVAVGERDLAFDAADEAFARAFLQWARVSTMASPRAWVFRVGLNVAHRRARRRSLERALLRRNEPVTELPAPAAELWALVAELPERQRLAVVLRHIGDLSEDQVATAMGIQRGTVSRTLRDAHQNLAAAMTDEMAAEEKG
jgi:RNA polymerase sigma factor (sigma-70 family)